MGNICGCKCESFGAHCCKENGGCGDKLYGNMDHCCDKKPGRDGKVGCGGNYYRAKPHCCSNKGGCGRQYTTHVKGGGVQVTCPYCSRPRQ